MTTGELHKYLTQHGVYLMGKLISCRTGEEAARPRQPQPRGSNNETLPEVKERKQKKRTAKQLGYYIDNDKRPGSRRRFLASEDRQ